MSLRAWIVVLILLAAGAGVAYWRFGGADTPPAETAQAGGAAGGPPPGVPVYAEPVKRDTVVRTIEAVGSLRSWDSVTVSPEVAGRVSEILVEEGQRVAKDTPLLTLDSSILEAELRQTKARLSLNRSEAVRAQALQKQGAGTTRALEQARADLTSDQAAIGAAEARLDKMTIYAPFDGVLGMRRVSAGQYVNPGDPIFTLESSGKLKVDFRIPEVYLKAVSVGQEVQVRPDAFADEAAFAGRVYAIDPAVDEAGRSLWLRAELDNVEGRLRPGLFARISLVVEKHENAILVPEQAVMPQGEEQFVFRVVDGKASLTKVTLGQRREGEVEILDGLQPTDTVVVEGHMKLQDGAPVTAMPLPDATPKAS